MEAAADILQHDGRESLESGEVGAEKSPGVRGGRGGLGGGEGGGEGTVETGGVG
jgi:hypothetical protein